VEPEQLRMNECVEDAIMGDLKVLGGPKVAAGLFFPTRTPDQGAALLRAWGNPNRIEEPSPEEFFRLIELARTKIGFSECARYMEQRLNCTIEFRNPEDERARLQQQFVNAVAVLNSIQRRLEQNEQRGLAP